MVVCDEPGSSAGAWLRILVKKVTNPGGVHDLHSILHRNGKGLAPEIGPRLCRCGPYCEGGIMRRLALPLLSASLGLSFLAPGAFADEQFEKRVRPLLAERCIRC